MLITILVTLIVSLSIAQPEILDHLADPSLLTAVLVVIYIAGGALLTAASTRSVVRALGRGELPSRKMFRAHWLLETEYRCWLIAGQGALLACGYGRWVQNSLGGSKIPLLEKLLVLTPFLVTVILGWVLDYRFHLAIRTARSDSQTPERAYWSRSEHVLYNIRHLLLFTIVPIAIILLVIDVLDMHLLPLAPAHARNTIYLTASLGTALTVFMIAPLILVRIWRTRRLEPGVLRSDLEDLCGQLKFKYRDILVWESDGVIANAAVMGLIPQVRFILVSDGIIDGLDHQHIRAVFAHEGGHVTSHHLGYLMLMGVAVMTLCESATIAAVELTDMSGPLSMLMMLTLVITFGGLVFGLVSRQFERQSDVIGAWASVPNPDNSPRITHEGAALFAGALQQIAQLNGINSNARNWRHGSIAHRIQYILMLGSTGGTRTEIDKKVKRVKIAIVLGAAAAVGSVVLQFVPLW